MSHSNKAISPLRQRMIEDMTLRKLGAATQAGYPSQHRRAKPHERSALLAQTVAALREGKMR